MNFEIKNVFLTIGGKSIVKDVSIKVFPGEIVGLMGPNGAGKTSTFNPVSYTHLTLPTICSV